MFDTFRGGKPNAKDLWAAEMTERNNKLYQLVEKIQQELKNSDDDDEVLDIGIFVEESGLGRLTHEEFEWIKSQIEE